MEDLPLTSENITALTLLVETSNGKLEAAAAASSSQAFNVGCSVGLMPGLIIIVLVFFLSKGSIAATAISILLVALFLILFANGVAYVSRSKAIDRLYNEQIKSEIDQILNEEMLTRQNFTRVASRVLPQDAALHKFLVENK
jgi:hypothetical protein